MCLLVLAGVPAWGGHPDSSEWTALFNADLSNADKPEGVWSVEQGVMTATEDEAIWTERDYDNFVLDLEFKTAPGSNSGILLYCTITCVDQQIDVELNGEHATSMDMALWTEKERNPDGSKIPS